MGSSQRYFEYAQECIRWAAEAEERSTQDLLVDMAKARNFRSSAEALVAETKHLSINARAKLAWQIQDLNPDGACGDASAATAEKGRAVLDHIASQFIEMLRDLDATRPDAWLREPR